jgi:hypothetical protein
VQIPEILKPVQAVVSETKLSHNFPVPLTPDSGLRWVKTKFTAPRETPRARAPETEKKAKSTNCVAGVGIPWRKKEYRYCLNQS